MALWTKQCARPGCHGLISAPCRSALARRTYCGRSCVQWATTEVRRLGQEDAALRKALRTIQQAVGVSGPPDEALVKAVRLIRLRAYQAGWTCVTRKIRRALKRGELVYRRDKAAA